MMDVSKMSGLEVLNAMAAGKLPPPSISETIPMTGMAFEEGRVTFTARADGRHLNPMGGVHGGFAATVMDTATGLPVHTMLEAGVGYGTVDLNVKMMRPVPRDQDLVAEGRVTHISKSLAVSEATLKTQDGKLLASATATCFLQRPKG
jgi:uncharacterized protein (TIGR00369 family)